MGDWPPVIEILFMDPEDLPPSDRLSARQQDAALLRELQDHGKPSQKERGTARTPNSARPRTGLP